MLEKSNGGIEQNLRREEYKVSEQAIRSKVLRVMAEELNSMAKIIESNKELSFDPGSRDRRREGLGEIIWSPNLSIELNKGVSLGFQLTPDNLRDFLSDSKKFLELLNSHLHVLSNDDASDDWAHAVLEKDGTVVIRIPTKGEWDVINEAEKKTK